MQPTRRFLLAAGAALLAAPAVAAPALADGAPAAADPRMAQRSLGPADAKVTVEEWFSYTCPHCARFAADVFPEVQAQLIDTGKIRYVFCEYPRDQLDLMAAMVARALPPERFEPFMESLLESQQHWAYDRSVDPKEELAKMAALAGMPRDLFDRTIADTALKSAILAQQAAAEKAYQINSTPTFIVNGRAHSGEMNFDEFEKMVGVS
jgi:protein-disulfide isomerase